MFINCLLDSSSEGIFCIISTLIGISAQKQVNHLVYFAYCINKPIGVQ